MSRSIEAMAKAAADHWVACATAAIRERGAFHVAFSGGSTPKHLHRCLLQEEYRRQVDWSRVHAWFGDERMVPRDHPDSNFRMLRETLLDHVEIPAEQIHPMVDDELLASAEPARSVPLLARNYARLLEARLPREAGRLRFDLIMLGMGADGHTASLFPGTAILGERERTVAEVWVGKLQSWRVSLTFPVIEQARRRLLLIAGEDKAPVLHEVLDAAGDYPISRVAALPDSDWFLDAAAASRLRGV